MNKHGSTARNNNFGSTDDDHESFKIFDKYYHCAKIIFVHVCAVTRYTYFDDGGLVATMVIWYETIVYGSKPTGK